MADQEHAAEPVDVHRPPSGIDVTKPSIARSYDYVLFGKDNYEIDRMFARQIIARYPEVPAFARANRAFVGRAVRYLAEEAGIRQFIDNGSGLPTQDNVHQVAQRADPSARVVYVDNDPIVLAHGRALLTDNRNTAVITADLAHPDEILADPDVRRLIDFDQPVGLLYVAVLHGLSDDAEAYGAVARMLDAVPSGSHLVISHPVSGDDQAKAEFAELVEPLESTRGDSPWGRLRSTAEIARFYDGLEVVEPGLGDVGSWRLDLGPARVTPPVGLEDGVEWPPELLAEPGEDITLWMFGGVGRKP